MSPSRTTLLILVFLSAGLGAAHADSQIGYQCQQLRPSDPPCPSVGPKGESTPGDLRERTHSLLLPTGNLLSKGDTAVQINEMGLYNRVAYGVTDRVELHAGLVVPVALNLGAKVALLDPAGPLRLTAGATIWKAAMGDSDGESVVTAGMTVAYQTESFNVHASVETARQLGDEDVVGGYTFGALARLSPKFAVSAELLKLGFDDQGPACCTEAAVVGAKLMGESWDFDLGVLTPLGEEHSPFLLPIVAASTRL